jgi:hypothetical protein
VGKILEMTMHKESLIGKTGKSGKSTKVEAAQTRYQSALRSRTAAEAARLDRKRPLQPLVLQVLQMETETKVKTPEARIIRVNTQEITEGKITLTMAVVTAATEAKSHLNAE